MPTKVVTDSACSLPAELARARGVTIVPMQIEIGGQTSTTEDVTIDEVLSHPPGSVRTAAPSPGAFLEACAGDDDVLVLTVAQQMSASFQAARVAAGMMTDRRVEVLDTETAAGAQGLVVLAAAAAAAGGAGLDAVLAAAARTVARVRFVAAVAGLDFLVQSGRVPSIAGFAGRLFGLQPLFAFEHGAARKMRPAAGRAAALQRMTDTWRKSRPDEDVALHVAVVHACAPQDAASLLDEISGEAQIGDAFVGEFGPVMVAHTGPGLVGLGWWWGD